MESTTDNVRSQMRKGVLEYCILCILSKQEAYASSIIDSLKAANMIVVEGTLYPPPRKYYGITEKGRAQLAEMDAAWQEMVESIDALKK